MKIIESFAGTIITLIILILNTSCTSNELPKPNIIWIISEDNSPFLGCYGDSFATTPNLDRFAEKSVKFLNAFANAPVCAPSRSTLISGMYATSMGTQHMRSENPSPQFMRFFPYYLRKAGYFTSNRVKKDYNTSDQDSVWDIDNWWGWNDALKGKKKDQPFFIMYNTWMSHESKIHPESDNFEYFSGTMSEHGVDSTLYTKWWNNANHDAEKVPIPPYHPRTKLMKRDWAKYYDCVELMDREVGVILQKLEEDSLMENTIVFYFSDHGGVLGRSKRFVFESGLRVPMMLYIPEKYEHLKDYEMGGETDDVVSFVDLAPTMMDLAGIEIPDYFQGSSIVNEKSGEDKEYAFGFRGRMDERYDMARTVRNKNFRYIRNYMPHRIYGGRINYLWKAESMQSWQKEFQDGKLTETQSAFWNVKPVEELYDVKNDPHNVNNLADDPKFEKDLIKLRGVLKEHLISSKDLGFFPEAEMVRRYQGKTPYDLIRDDDFPIEKVVEIANIATAAETGNLDYLIKLLGDDEPVIRYWGAIGCSILKEKAERAKDKLIELTSDISPSVRIAAAEAIYYLGENKKAQEILTDILKLPKFKKDDHVDNTDLYANHFAVAKALNVIDALNIDTPEIRKLVREIAESERAGKRDYDKRIALYLISKYRI